MNSDRLFNFACIVLVIWGALACVLFASCSPTPDDAMPDTAMVGVPFTGDMDNAYLYVGWSIRQPSEWKEAE